MTVIHKLISAKSIKWDIHQLSKINEIGKRENLTTPQKTILSSIRVLQQEQARKVQEKVSLFRKKVDPLQHLSPPIKNAINYVLIKPVSDGCNLHCTYCYEGPVGVRQKFTRMGFEELERIIDNVCSQGNTRVGFSFHGGEPLLAGLDFFLYAMAIQDRYRKQGITVENTVQTNGTLINDEWIRFFQEYHFTVGISFDGVRAIHDKHRIFGNKKGSYYKVLASIVKIQATKIPLGIISVITNEHVGFAVEHFNAFADLNILDFAVTPSFGLVGDIDVGTVDALAFSNYVIDMFEAWIESGRSDMKIRVVQDAIKGFIGQELAICSLAGTCSKIIAIEPNGNVKSCTRSCGEAEKVFGNLNNDTLENILKGDIYERFVVSEKAGQNTASHCEWFEICHNGCSANRTKDGHVDVTGTGRFCDCDGLPGHEKGYAGIYRHIKNRISELLEI